MEWKLKKDDLAETVVFNLVSAGPDQVPEWGDEGQVRPLHTHGVEAYQRTWGQVFTVQGDDSRKSIT